jgi:hypothetical protein
MSAMPHKAILLIALMASLYADQLFAKQASLDTPYPEARPRPASDIEIQQDSILGEAFTIYRNCLGQALMEQGDATTEKSFVASLKAQSMTADTLTNVVIESCIVTRTDLRTAIESQIGKERDGKFIAIDTAKIVTLEMFDDEIDEMNDELRANLSKLLE